MSAFFPKLPIIDRYIIKELLPSFLFGMVVFSIIAELIGISFEQVRFIVHRGLSLDVSLTIHYLKLPAFIAITIPFATLFSTIITYSSLARNSEIIAFQSIGISLFRLIMPTLAMSLIFALVMFSLNEFIVPPANYQAALLLEKVMNVNRGELAKYNKKEIVYPELIKDPQTEKRYLKVLFFADKFNGKSIEEIVVLFFDDQGLKEIVIAKLARWNEQKELWELYDGSRNIINQEGDFDKILNFARLEVQELQEKILEYVEESRDNREMNIWELKQYLSIIQTTNQVKKIRQLQISIQERLAIPLSCVGFALVGSVVGINAKSNNGFGMTIIIIFGYYMISFLSTSLSSIGVIPIVLGVWSPNLLLGTIGFYLLVKVKYSLTGN